MDMLKKSNQQKTSCVFDHLMWQTQLEKVRNSLKSKANLKKVDSNFEKSGDQNILTNKVNSKSNHETSQLLLSFFKRNKTLEPKIGVTNF